MHDTPQKISLITQTQAVLIEGMRQRRWQHELPGERILSSELRISRWTLRAALAELSRLGYLNIAQGRPCAITPLALQAKQRRPSMRKVALIVPAPLSKLRLFVSLWVDELRIILNAQGIEFSVLDAPKAYRPNPDHALESIVDKHPFHDWVLMLSTRAMQEWFQTRSEFALVAGTRFEGIHLPAVDIASHAVGVHAAHTLLGLGHRRMALFIPRIANAGVLAAETGLRQAISRAKYADAHITVVACDEEPTDVCRTVDRLLAEASRPTVLIGARAAATLTAFSHVTRLGLRVPHNVSLLSIEWEGFLDMVVPRIAHYRFSPAQFARHMSRGILRTSA